ncbi:MAG: ion transporter [Cyanobacteria bacterium P01_D01_bin.73]
MDRVCARIARSPRFQRLILGSIVLAIVIAGLETEPWMISNGKVIIHVLDKLILLVFGFEAAVKILAEGRHPLRYFRDPWNTFDFLILVFLLLPFWGSFFAIFRVGRLLRILRVVTTFPRLRLLISTLLQSLPSIGYLLLILGLLFYVYGVGGTCLFRGNDPVYFGSLGRAILSLFTVVTLEGWTTTMYTQMYGCDRYGYESFPELCVAPEQFPAIAPIFFISFVLIGALVILNLFVGVIISSMMTSIDEMEETKPQQKITGPASAPANDTSASQGQIQRIEAQLNLIQGQIQDLVQTVQGNPNQTDSNPPEFRR